jgi:hypothetical protein
MGSCVPCPVEYPWLEYRSVSTTPFSPSAAALKQPEAIAVISSILAIFRGGFSKTIECFQNPYIIKQQAFVGGACVCHGHFGGGACVDTDTGSSPKKEHAQKCPNKSPPDVVAVMTRSLMTQQPASPPDVSP